MLARPEFNFSRLLCVHRIAAFHAWTRPDHLTNWFAPAGTTLVHATSEPRRNGRFALKLKATSGKCYSCRGRYWDVQPPTRLLLHDTLFDFGGRKLFDALTTVEFQPANGGCRLSLGSIVTKIHAAARHLPVDGLQEGWADVLDRFERYCERLAISAPQTGNTNAGMWAA